MPKEKPLELVRIPLSQIKPDPKNAKDHDVGLIIESFKRFGYVNPMVLNADDFLLAGHGRRKGLIAMQSGGEAPPKNIEAEGDEWIVPVGIGSKFNKQDATAYRLVDNRSTEQGGYDEPQLLENLMELSKNGGLEATGYDTEDVDRLFQLLNPNLEEVAVSDEAEKLQRKWKTKSGQLWEIGRHRLFCGDATSEQDLTQLLDGAKPDLCLTDPPYGVGVEYASHEDSVEELGRLVDGFLPLARRAPVVLVTSGISNHRLYPTPDWMLSWVEPAGTGCGPWGYMCWQPVLAYGKDPYLKRGRGSRPDTFVGDGEGASNDDHPVAKPLKVWSWLLKRGTVGIDTIVYDPFIGSGTTMVAAEQLNRTCYGMEIEPKYVAVTLERMSTMDLEPDLISGA